MAVRYTSFRIKAGWEKVMSNRGINLPFFAVPPAEYSQQYFSDMVQSYSSYLQSQNNPGVGRQTTMAITDLPVSTTGLRDGDLYNENGFVRVYSSTSGANVGSCLKTAFFENTSGYQSTTTISTEIGTYTPLSTTNSIIGICTVLARYREASKDPGFKLDVTAKVLPSNVLVVDGSEIFMQGEWADSGLNFIRGSLIGTFKMDPLKIDASGNFVVDFDVTGIGGTSSSTLNVYYQSLLLMEVTT